MINNLIFNYKEIYDLFALENSKCVKKFEKMLKITKSKKLWGSIKTDRSIFVKNHVQVFPSHIKGFWEEKKNWKKTSYTFCITRILTVHKRLSFEREKTLKKLVGKRRTISALFKNVIRSHVFYSLTFIPDYNIPNYNTYNVFWDGSYKNLIFCTHMIHLWKCIFLIFRSVFL